MGREGKRREAVCSLEVGRVEKDEASEVRGRCQGSHARWTDSVAVQCERLNGIGPHLKKAAATAMRRGTA